MVLVQKDEFCNVSISQGEKEYIIENNANYFKMGVNEGRVFQALSNGLDHLEIMSKFHVTEHDLTSFVDFLRAQHIIGKTPKKTKNNIFFYKIQLFDVDGVVTKCVDFIRQHSSIFKMLFVLYNLCIVTGLGLFIRNFSEIFRLESIKMQGPQYVLLYVLALLTVVMHEFAHGITCKLNGCKVGKIGIIFILFQPAFYCDISGVRMLQNSKHKQIMTSLAGIYLNLFLACISAICFHFTHSHFAATFTFIQLSFILSNIVPFIKLDGYWVLSFWTGITNLFTKSRRGLHYILDGKNKQERFIGWYGLFSWIFMLFSLGSMVYALYGLFGKLIVWIQGLL